MQKLQTQHLTRAAAVGAAYAVLSLFSSVFSLTFGVVQCRFSEALVRTPLFLSGDGLGPVRRMPHHQYIESPMVCWT